MEKKIESARETFFHMITHDMRAPLTSIQGYAQLMGKCVTQTEILEKFSQLEEHRYMGFGLGLAMCKMAVDLHGGRIWVYPQEGRGSTFGFPVPGGGKHV